MENRRKFIKTTATFAAFSLIADWASAIPETDQLGEILPQRQLIRNGEKVTSFCLGGYHLGRHACQRDHSQNPGDGKKRAGKI